ncbi:MAG: hypothetical protein E7086_07005 [Bacteroidales bacterium]|nr:hypothetical protein [Bacteroidales bacterium]
MKAEVLVSLQLTAIIIMIACGPMLFSSTFATILFISAFYIFIRCSIYIEKNAKRLLRECNRRKE